MSTRIPTNMQHGIALALIAGIVIYTYLGVLDNALLNWDDNRYVLHPRLSPLNLDSLWWMLAGGDHDLWHPLTWLTLALDRHLFGLDPRAFHLHNLVWHLLNAGLVYALTLRLLALVPGSAAWSPVQVWLAALVAALGFGVHPLHVESVAWTVERKDVLCLFFVLATLLAHLRYATTPAASRRSWYGATVALALCAVMSKPLAVTLPALLLVLDYYPLRRLTLSRDRAFWRAHRTVLLEKAPFLMISLLATLLTLLGALREGAVQPYPLEARLVNAFAGIAFYLEKLLLPLDLGPLYPFPEGGASSLWSSRLPAILFSLAVSAWVLYRAVQGVRLWAATWLFFLIALLPNIGIIQAGMQAYADRFSYLPSIPLHILAGTGIGALWGRRLPRGARIAILGGCCLALGGLILLTKEQVSVWRSDGTLWARAESLVPGHPFLLDNLAAALLREGDREGARVAYERLIVTSPSVFGHYEVLAGLYQALGKTEEALRVYDVALRNQFVLDAPLSLVHTQRAVLLCRAGRFAEAREVAQKAWSLSSRKTGISLLLKDIDAGRCD